MTAVVMHFILIIFLLCYCSANKWYSDDSSAAIVRIYRWIKSRQKRFFIRYSFAEKRPREYCVQYEANRIDQKNLSSYTPIKPSKVSGMPQRSVVYKECQLILEIRFFPGILIVLYLRVYARGNECVLVCFCLHDYVAEMSSAGPHSKRPHRLPQINRDHYQLQAFN